MGKFKILGIEHVAIAVKDPSALTNFFGSLLDIKYKGKEKIEDQKVFTDIFDTGSGKIELLEESGSDSPISKFLNKKGPGVHHIAFLVDDISLAIEQLSCSGIEFVDKSPRVGAEGFLIAFIHPKSSPGILVELCQKP